MPETAPGPILGPLDESPRYWVTVYVLQFFDSLVRRPNIEVVIAGLPEVLAASNQFSGHRLLHRLHRAGECATFGFTHQKVDVLGHHHVSGDEEFVADSRLLQRQLEQVACLSAGQKRLATVATKRQEVQGASFLIPPKTRRHVETLPKVRKRVSDVGTEKCPALPSVERGTQRSCFAHSACSATIAHIRRCGKSSPSYVVSRASRFIEKNR